MNICNKYGDCGWNSPKPKGYRWKFEEYLTELELNTKRFIDIRQGEKQPHDTINRYYWDVCGNWGIRAGGGLVIIETNRDAGDLDILPETLTCESPHGEKFRFFNVEGSVGDEVEKVAGTREFAVLPCGYVWVENAHVIGPGSQLDENGCTEDGCQTCGLAGSGYFEIVHEPEHGITTIRTETLIQAIIEGDGLLDYPL